MTHLQPGDPAPEFSARNESNKTVHLSDYQGQKVILYFYPKDDTPGCTTQACGFRDRFAEIQEQNAVVLGISPDDAESHRSFKQKYGLPFPLLVDEGHEIAQKYGVWGEKTRGDRTYMGIVRSHFVIGEDGTLLETRYNVSPEASTPEALAQLG